MKPRKAIPRSTKPIKRSRVRATGKPSRRFKDRRDPGYCKWIRTLPCVVATEARRFPERGSPECGGPIECAHVKPRSLGGNDVANTVPMCMKHHREQHRVGARTFEATYRMNLEAKALYLGAVQPPKCERDFPERFA